jgi:hypothetical protein
MEARDWWTREWSGSACLDERLDWKRAIRPTPASETYAHVRILSAASMDPAKAPATPANADPLTYARVHTTNNDTDWTKTKQSRASLVHDTGLTNGHPSKRHATLPTVRV